MIGRASRLLCLAGGLATLVITLLVCYDVLMRYFVGEPQLFVDELSSFLLVLVIFGGVAETFRAGAHVRVDLVAARLPAAARAWLRVVTLGLGVVLLAVIIWVTTQSALTAYRYERVSTVMLYPIWLPMLLIPLGLLTMALAMLTAFVRQWRAATGPEPHRDEVPLDGSRG
jgi:TRAP-type C4-dicarboxylate transport system permease small subunit